MWRKLSGVVVSASLLGCAAPVPPAPPQGPPVTGRWQVIQGESTYYDDKGVLTGASVKNPILLDTQTGATWVQIPRPGTDGSDWKPLQRTP